MANYQHTFEENITAIREEVYGPRIREAITEALGQSIEAIEQLVATAKSTVQGALVTEVDTKKRELENLITALNTRIGQMQQTMDTLERIARDTPVYVHLNQIENDDWEMQVVNPS
jgi:hypothetical protein